MPRPGMAVFRKSRTAIRRGAKFGLHVRYRSDVCHFALSVIGWRCEVALRHKRFSGVRPVPGVGAGQSIGGQRWGPTKGGETSPLSRSELAGPLPALWRGLGVGRADGQKLVTDPIGAEWNLWMCGCQRRMARTWRGGGGTRLQPRTCFPRAFAFNSPRAQIAETGRQNKSGRTGQLVSTPSTGLLLPRFFVWAVLKNRW